MRGRNGETDSNVENVSKTYNFSMIMSVFTYDPGAGIGLAGELWPEVASTLTFWRLTERRAWVGWLVGWLSGGREREQLPYKKFLMWSHLGQSLHR